MSDSRVEEARAREYRRVIHRHGLCQCDHVREDSECEVLRTEVIAALRAEQPPKVSEYTCLSCPYRTPLKAGAVAHNESAGHALAIVAEQPAAVTCDGEHHCDIHGQLLVCVACLDKRGEP